MAATAKVGTGLTVTHTGMGTVKILSLNGPNCSRASIDATNMGTTTAMDFIPTTLYDGGEVDMDVEYLGVIPDISAAAESMVITLNGGKTLTFNAFITGFNPTVPLEDKMVANMTFKVTGAITEST